MAKVTITIEDRGVDKVHTNFDFDPPLRKDTPGTPALGVALDVLNALKKKRSASTRVPGEEEEE